jgi:hypothetical protein
MRSRLLFAACAAIAAFVILAATGCGGGSSSPDLARLAPPGSLVYIEGTVQPSGALKSNVDAIAQKIGGVDNLGNYIVSKLEEKADEEGEPFNFAKEVEPWLGTKAAVFYTAKEADSNNPAIAVESTDTAATQKFIESQVKSSHHPYRKATYHGVEYEFGGREPSAVGVVGDSLLMTGTESTFHEAVDASKGDSLAGDERFTDAFSEATDGSLADAYVDIGGLIRRSKKGMTPQAQTFFDSVNINPTEATAVASLIPGTNQVELDVSSNIGAGGTPAETAPDLLGSLPENSFAALATSNFGDRLMEGIDKLDESGIAGKVPPHRLKSGLKEAGIDLEAIVGSLGDAAVFATGSNRASLGGAAVFTTDNPTRASNTVSNIGLLLRTAHTPGVTALGGNATGFTIRSAELGRKPLVIAASEDRIAVAYGTPAALAALESQPASSLSESPDYKAAASSLGDTPIVGFVDGPASLQLAEALVPSSDTGFQEAVPYLQNIRFIAIGSSSSGETTKLKLVAGLTK